MKLFKILGESARDGNESNLQVAKDKEETIEKFIKEFKYNTFSKIYSEVIEEVDGYKIYLIQE